MVSQLSKLAELLEKGAVPSWVLKQLETHRDELVKGQQVTLYGPNGEVVTITPDEIHKSDPVPA